MWLDVVVLAPVVILGLEKLIYEGKCKLYCITLALSILSNYYLSIERHQHQHCDATVNIWPMVKSCFNRNVKKMTGSHISHWKINVYFFRKIDVAEFCKFICGGARVSYLL